MSRLGSTAAGAGGVVASWPDDGGPSGGAGMIAVLLVLGVAIAIGVGIWRASTAQRLAKHAGLDPRLATRMALLSDDGLEATYLASSLRQPPVGEVPSAAAAGVAIGRGAADRAGFAARPGPDHE